MAAISRRRLLLSVTPAVVLAAGFSGCGSDTSEVADDPSGPCARDGEPVPVTFGGSSTWYGQIPFMIAEQKGFFADQGIEFDYSVILASADRLRALTTGDIDFSNLGRRDVLSGMADGNESFYYFANVDDSPGSDALYARPGIESIEDLRGKKVAANTSAMITFMMNLEANGMTLEDVDFVELDATDMALALRKGDVDAVDVWRPPLNQVMEAVPEGSVIARDTDTPIYKRTGVTAAPDIVIVRREIVDEQPQLAQCIARATFEGVEYIKNNPEATAEAVASYFDAPPEDVLEGIKLFTYYGADNYQEHIKAHTEQMKFLGKWLNDHGMLDSVPDVEKWQRTDFVTQLESVS